MPVVHADLRRELHERNRPASSRAIHESLDRPEADRCVGFRPHKRGGVRDDDLPVPVVDVGTEGRYAGGTIDEEARR